MRPRSVTREARRALTIFIVNCELTRASPGSSASLFMRTPRTPPDRPPHPQRRSRQAEHATALDDLVEGGDPHFEGSTVAGL
jgi:hypothetical protein